MLYWNLTKYLKDRGWTNANQLAAGADIGYPAAWRIMHCIDNDEPMARLDGETHHALLAAFKLQRTPWALLEYRRK